MIQSVTLLIVLGVIEGERQRPIQEFIQAKYLGIALGIYALIQPFLFSNQSLNNSSALVCLTLIASLASIYMYYSLLKAEYIWHPSKQTRQYVDTYLVLAITSFAANCLTYLIPIFAFIAILIGITQSIYLFMSSSGYVHNMKTEKAQENPFLSFFSFH